MADNRRQFQRIEFEAPVIMQQNGKMLSTDVIDISLKGLLLKGEDFPFDLSKTVHIIMPLSDDVSIEMHALCSYSRDGASGFRWQQLDLESLTHLRRLLELNSEDATLLERELAHLSQG